jgi:hypothetical protein
VPASTKPWRFYRLSPNKKYLHYCEATERSAIRSGLDDLPERIDLALVADVSLQPPGGSGAAIAAAAAAAGVAAGANLAFSLLRAPDVSLADLVALNTSQFSEWTDGLGMLRGEGGVVSTKETADYIQILTDIGMKVKLLDLTGERVSVRAEERRDHAADVRRCRSRCPRRCRRRRCPCRRPSSLRTSDCCRRGSLSIPSSLPAAAAI